SDLRELRRILDANGGNTGAIVKIEKVEAIEHIEELISLSDGVMVARGDLGVEMDVWQVPLLQKGLTARCREAGKPVIIATQMLQALPPSPPPTRADAGAAATAPRDAPAAVCLPAEPATAHSPLAAVDVMRRVAEAPEPSRAEAPRHDMPNATPIGDGRVSAI